MESMGIKSFCLERRDLNNISCPAYDANSRSLFLSKETSAVDTNELNWCQSGFNGLPAQNDLINSLPPPAITLQLQHPIN